MNRAERRRTNKPKEPVYNLTASQIQQFKTEATQQAVKKSFKLMLCIPVMVIHDKYGQLMKKEGREERFANLILELYDSFEKGYITLQDLEDCLYKETGIRLE